MKKYTPLLFAIVMIAMLFFSWSIILTYNSNQEKSYNQQLQKAQKLEKKGIYIDAVGEYEKLLNMKPEDGETAIKIADLYEELDQSDNYIQALKKAIKVDPDNLDTYIRLADVYTEMKSKDELYDVLTDASAVAPDDQNIKNRLIELKKEFNVVGLGDLEEFDDFDIGDLYKHDTYGFCAKLKRGDQYSLVSPGGNLLIDALYEDIGMRKDSLLAVKENGQYFYVDNNMYKKLVPDVDVEFLGTFGEGKAPVGYQGKYGYVNKGLYQLKDGSETFPADKDGNIVYSFEYDYAGAFANNTAAVKKGDKWALINGDLSTVTDFEFDDILMDDYGFCSTYERVIVKKNNEFYIYDCQGNQISGPYEDAKLFRSKQPAAVKQNGKWGFVNQKGEMIIEPAYDDADSFCVSYAPIKKGAKWGAIGEDGEMLIEPQFKEFHFFAENGQARIVNDEGRVCTISVHKYSGDD